ncbi:lipoyl(octanoyl) transferase LipB [Gammaproteobacteria bacterium]|nr:lipoyl(octanoyl) transferase LipB [Gammaproteobacteria bacterium]
MQQHVKTQPFSNEIWMVEHPPVYTLGRAANPEHRLRENHIPLVRTDRGGQITYHGPGQIIAYTMIEVSAFHLKPLDLVSKLEQAVIAFLAELGLIAIDDPNRRGVYLNGEKIASIGLKMHQGRSYHGIALNVKTDLKAFDDINPCGYNDLRVTNLNDHHPIRFEDTRLRFASHISLQLEGQHAE